MNTLQRLGMATAVLLMLAACGSTGINGNERAINMALDDLGVNLGEEINNVPNFRINGWHAVNDSYLIVTTGLHDHYLLSVAPPCPGLDFSFGISFERRTPTLSRGDYVLVDSLHRRGMDRCQIMDITRLVDRDQAADGE